MIRRAALLALVVVIAPALVAQDPAPPVTAAPAAKAEVAVDPVIEAWVKILCAKIADANQTVRQSAQQGLVTVGKPAIAQLQALAAGSDQAVAAEAKRVLDRIERMGQRGQDGRPGARQGGAAQTDQLMKDLGLNSEQEAKAKSLLDENRQKSREIFSQIQDGTLTREEARAAMEELRAETDKQLKGVLSEEQFKKYEETMRNSGGMGGGQGGPGGQGGRRRRGGGG